MFRDLAITEQSLAKKMNYHEYASALLRKRHNHDQKRDQIGPYLNSQHRGQPYHCSASSRAAHRSLLTFHVLQTGQIDNWSQIWYHRTTNIHLSYYKSNSFS